MIVTLGVLLVSSLLMTAAFVAAEGDIHLAQRDTAAKKAYYAAQAGVADYLYHLTQDGNYLTYCTKPPVENKALAEYYKTGSKEEKITLAELEKENKLVPVPSFEEKGKPVGSGESYVIQLVPANGAAGCSTSNVVGTMIESSGPAAGSFRIASTGVAEGVHRTIVATIKNANFVSYVWYSVYETGDPTLYGPPPEKNPNFYTVCGSYWPRPGQCNTFNNYFISGEKVNGPMHTEDHVGICGSPVFGRNANDRIEFGSRGAPEGEGYSNQGIKCEEKPEFVGTHIPPSKVLSITPPPGDEELEHIVEPKYRFEGKTEIVLTGGTMTVTEHVGSKTLQKTTPNVPYPPSGVIYVAGGACPPYSPFGPSPGYTEDSACGNVYVNGNYTQSLTIAAQNDVVINGNITTTGWNEGEHKPTTSSMLGLIANNFVRVYHPLEGAREPKYTKCGASKNAASDLKSPTIYAGILALKHSFIVDNFDCGKPELGPLKVYGALASLFTDGMTGVFSGKTVLSGYGYNLEYDNRLQVAEPPHFLNPIQAAWYAQRETLATHP